MGIIEEVQAGSLAEALGIKAGDDLLSINGHGLRDQLDYQFYQNAAELSLQVRRENELKTLQVQKEEFDELGISFADATFDKMHVCSNKCSFCFIRQLPKGLRKTLYLTDDDYRYSFLFGNYITLTNMSQAEKQRIVEQHLSPLCMSIHATDDQVRRAMLGNEQAKAVLEELDFFLQKGICVEAQVVLLPGINDGATLEKTIRDLGERYPAVESLAIVPVGLTKFREKLPKLQRFTKEAARNVIAMVEGWQEKYLKEFGTRFVFLGDEFYLLAELELPEDEAYENYLQYENGIGMVRTFLEEVKSFPPKRIVKTELQQYTNIYFLTGQAFAPVLQLTLAEAQKELPIQVIPVVNYFFGTTITVAGLLTGQDLLASMKRQAAAEQSLFIVTELTLNRDQLFLDEMSQAELTAACPGELRYLPNDGYELFAMLYQEI
ncbi:MAG: DUF512 domain-containing protein [Clostridia bacterium]